MIQRTGTVPTRRGPDFPATLQKLDLKQRIDELEPINDDPADVDLEWVRVDDRLASTLEAAERGDLTPSEVVDQVAGALGYESPIVDPFDDYDH